MNRVEDIVAKVDTLPPMADTMARLMGVVHDPRSSVTDIVDVIRYDEAITAEVLRMCNSAYFGFNRQINSLQDAMVYLGTAKLLHLVMAVHGDALLGKAQAGYGLEPGALWHHSVATAIACDAMGEKLDLPNKDQLFTMGLLHDIGKVVLSEYVAAEYAEIVRLVNEDHHAFDEAERMVLGYDHAETGMLLAERWQLPEEIVKGIRWHHAPPDDDDTLVDVIYLGNILSIMLGFGIGCDGLSYRADQEILVRHGLTERDLESIGAEVAVNVAQVRNTIASE